MKTVQKAGIAWFHETEYAELRVLFVDGDRLPETYQEGLEKAENGIRKLRRDGIDVIKVYIELDTFPAWCRERGLDIDAKARMNFAAGVAARNR